MPGPEFRPVSPDEIRRRWREYRDATRPQGAEGPAPSPEPDPAPVNLDAVLTLDGSRVLVLRGRPYWVDPVPFAAGARLQDAFLRLRDRRPAEGSEERAAYFAGLREVALLAWPLLREVGRVRRALRAARLLPNRLLTCSEAELAMVATFCLGSRMMSSVGIRQPMAPARRQTSSMRH